MVSFGLGHIAYIIGFSHAGYSMGGTPQPVIEIIWLVAAIILWYLVVFRGSEKTLLHYAALPYSLLLAATAGVATMRAFQYAAFIPIAVGAALFLLSDLILAARLFNNARFRLIDDADFFRGRCDGYGSHDLLLVFLSPADKWRTVIDPGSDRFDFIRRLDSCWKRKDATRKRVQRENGRAFPEAAFHDGEGLVFGILETLA